jgi:glycosyltransferase 2 family protein
VLDRSAARWRWVRRLAPWVITATVVTAILIRYPLARIVEEVQRGELLAMAPVALVAIGTMWFVITAADHLVLAPLTGPLRYRDLLAGKAGVSVLNGLGLAFNFGGYAVWIRRRFGVAPGAAAGTVLLLALADLAAVALLASATLWLAGDPAGLGRSRLAMIALGVAALALAVLMWQPRPGRHTLLEPWRAVSRTRRLASVLVRCGNISILVLATSAAARAFGLPLPLAAMVTYLPILLVIGALPINVAGFGPIQAAWLAAFTPWASGPQILAFQFLWQLALLGALLVRGAPFLRRVVADVARPACERAAPD